MLFRTRMSTHLSVSAAFAATVVLATACTGAGSGATNDEGPQSSRHGGTAVVAVSGDIPHLNTQLVSHSSSQFIAPLWGDALLAWDGEGELAPRMAESWEVSEDQKTYTFSLREGVKWSDGHPFTADDVVFTLTEMAQHNTYMTSILPIINEVEKVDEYTVAVHLKEPFAAFLNVLTRPQGVLMPMHIYSEGNPATNSANTDPVGLGPYKLEKWERGRALVFVRNPHYWDKPKPYFDQVQVDLIQSPAQHANALIKGTVDFAEIPITQVPKVRESANSSGIRVFQLDTPSPGRLSVDFNLQHEALSNREVRQALFMAINRERIAQDAQHGTADPAVSAIPVVFDELYSESVDYQKMYPYDPAKARSMLDDAGFPVRNGKRFSVEIAVTSARDAWVAAARAILSNWEAVGIDVKLTTLDHQLWLEKVYRNRDFDVSIVRLAAGSDPTVGIDRSFTCNDQTINYVNPTGYCNQELDEIVEKAASAPPDERQKYYEEYAQIVARDMPEATLTSTSEVFGVSERFGNIDQDFSISNEMYPNFDDMWIKESG